MEVKIYPITAFLLLLSTQVWCTQSKTILIDLAKQKLFAMQDGKTVLSTDISTGMVGHETPIGTFKIFDKQKVHSSTEYPRRANGENGGAEMPYTMKITKWGVAIHQGYVKKENGKGVPLSHGCIRVPKRISKKLFEWSRLRTTVKIIGKTTYTDSLNKQFQEEDAYYARKVKHYRDEYGDWSEDGGPLVYDDGSMEPAFY